MIRKHLKFLLPTIAISLVLLLTVEPEAMGKSNIAASGLAAIMPIVAPLPTMQQNFAVGKPTRWRNLKLGRATNLKRTKD